VTYSALMCGRELLVIVWKARMFCHIDLSQPLLLEDVSLAVRARMWYMHEVLRHILVLLYEMFSVTPTMTTDR
jgi:hypothetical protein